MILTYRRERASETCCSLLHQTRVLEDRGRILNELESSFIPTPCYPIAQVPDFDFRIQKGKKVDPFIIIKDIQTWQNLSCLSTVNHRHFQSGPQFFQRDSHFASGLAKAEWIPPAPCTANPRHEVISPYSDVTVETYICSHLRSFVFLLFFSHLCEVFGLDSEQIIPILQKKYHVTLK